MNAVNTSCDIAIVGGGAAGLASAIAAARAVAAAGSQARICVLEASERVGRSILKTGNGRCNFSNEHIFDGKNLHEYRNADFVRKALGALAERQCGLQDVAAGAGLADDRFTDCPYSYDPILEFFEGMGLEWRQEEDGRRYPLANKASVVLDVLRAEAARLGVEEVCKSEVRALEPPARDGGQFSLHLVGGKLWHAKSVVLACGGKAAGRLAVSALEAPPVAPVLGPLKVAEEDRAITRALDNIRVHCSLFLSRDDENDSSQALHVKSSSGELLFRSYGVSGICVFDLSRYAQPGDYLKVNFLQIDDFDQMRHYLEERLVQLEAVSAPVSYERYLRGMLLPRVAHALLRNSGIDPASSVTGAQGLEELFQMLGMFTLVVEGMGPSEQCQVCRGGFAVDLFDGGSMQCVEVPGLFAAGEALDVDGPCGGYNLHWAWASGLLAGDAAAVSLLAGA